MRYWTECQEFYQEFRRAYRNTGSILPSSRGLARALVSPMRKRQGPARVLEVGPGTGAVTDEILRQLRPATASTWWRSIRILSKCSAAVSRRNRFGASRRPQTELIHAPLQDVPGVAVYDYMISGLPLNNFPLSLVREIFQAYRRLLKPAGVLSYFEYLAIRDVKISLVAKKEQRRLRVLSKFLERRIRAYQVSEQRVFLNIPPAVARHFCFSPAANSAMQQVR